MLTHRAKYAIKALLHLARHQGDGPVQASAIAAAEAIPHKFLEAILIQLRHKGIVRSKAGKGGGHALAKAPGEIDILSVIRAIDGPVAPLPCLSHTAYQRCSDCVSEATCGVRRVLAQAHETLVEHLARKSLLDGLESAQKPARRPGRPASRTA
jgi:Rrf2 family protein